MLKPPPITAAVKRSSNGVFWSAIDLAWEMSPSPSDTDFKMFGSGHFSG